MRKNYFDKLIRYMKNVYHIENGINKLTDGRINPTYETANVVTFTQPSFLSTSTENSVATGTFSGNMQIEIEASQGAHGLDVSSISQYGSGEAEVLFNAGQKMFVTDAETKGGILYIKAIIK